MGGLFGSKPKPKATPVPTADPSTVQANFEAVEDSELDAKNKKKAGKTSLTVKRTGTALSKGVNTGAGLTVTRKAVK